MKKYILTMTFLFFIVKANCQELKSKSAAEKLLSELELIKAGYYDIRLPTRIACLTGIYPKIIDLNYSGVCYKPDKVELETWEVWINKNKSKLKYKSSNRDPSKYEIIFEDDEGNIRDAYCQ